MIISSIKDGMTLIEGRPIELIQEATIIFDGMIKETPEILLTVLSVYADDIEKLNPDDYREKIKLLSFIAETSKRKCRKENKND